jgi:antitoxin PrlF
MNDFGDNPFIALNRKEIMSNATLTSKGQTTIPKEIRDSLGLKPQDKLSFTLLPNGTVIMRAKTRKLLDLAGIANYTGPTISIEQMRIGK